MIADYISRSSLNHIGDATYLDTRWVQWIGGQHPVMSYLHQFDYIFAVCVIFTFLDAWNIGMTSVNGTPSVHLLLNGRLLNVNVGANDVANSFATSVSSRSLTLKQAMLVAAVCEFGGSVSVGDRVADTVRTKIIDPDHYNGHPQVLLLAMMCAIVGSSTFLTFATRYGMPVSTTHSIVGGLVGAATASVGIDKVNWTWNGVPQVFAAWVVAPGIAGLLGGLLFFMTKKTILTRPKAIQRALFSIPVYTFITIGSICSRSFPNAFHLAQRANEGNSAGCMEGRQVQGATGSSLDHGRSSTRERHRRFAINIRVALALGAYNARGLDTSMVPPLSRALGSQTSTATTDSLWLCQAADQGLLSRPSYC